MIPLAVVSRSFGPRFSAKELARMNRQGHPDLASHGGCWINDYDCGAPDCVMGSRDGEPEIVERVGKEIRS